MAVQDKITEIIVEQLGVKAEEVTPEASFVDDLGADSLDTVELVMALEEEFGIEIPDEDAEKIQTVGPLVTAIDERQNRIVVCDGFHNITKKRIYINHLYYFFMGANPEN